MHDSRLMLTGHIQSKLAGYADKRACNAYNCVAVPAAKAARQRPGGRGIQLVISSAQRRPGRPSAGAA